MSQEKIHRGWAGARKWFQEAILELWEGLHCEVKEISEGSDDRVLLDLSITARGKASGADTELRRWQVFRTVDGKIARRWVFLNRAEALQPPELSE